MAEAPQLQPNTDLAVANTGNQDPVNDRLNFKLNPGLTVSSLRQQYDIKTPAEQQSAQPPDQRGFLRKAVDFIGEPIEKLIVRDIGGIMRANDVAKASNTAETQAIQVIQDSKNKFNQGIITKDEFTKRLQHIRDMGTANLGDELPTAKQVIGDIAGTALTVAPVWEMKALKGLPVLQKLLRGGVIGSGFMASQAASENQTAEKIIQNAGVGFLFGAPMELLGGYGLKLLGSLGSKVVPKIVSEGAGKVAGTLEKGFQTKVMEKISPIVSSVMSRLKNDFGEHGAQIAQIFENATLRTKTQIGTAIDKLNKTGFFNLTDEAAWKNPDSLLNQLQGKFQAGKEGTFKVADQMRKEISAMATEILPQYRGLQNYFPHYIHEANYLKSGKIREDILQNAVLNEGFPDVATAGNALDDFIKIMEEGAGVQGAKTNKWIQYMLDKGYAQNEQEALGKTVRYFGSKSTPTRGTSQFLENPRDMNIPFYDPNPVRVLPLYSMDAYRNLNLAQGFGADNQILNELVGKAVQQTETGVKVNPKDLDKLVNILFNHMDKASTPLEKGAAWLRALNQIKLSFSAFINATQSLNPLMVSDYGPFFKGLHTALTNKSAFLENGLKTGASVEYFIRNELAKKGYTPSFSDWYLRKIGMGVTERFNRNLSANVGITYAQKVAEQAGLKVDSATEQKVLALLEKQKTEQVELGAKMADVRKGAMEQYNKDFPLPFNDPQYKLESITQAQGRLNRLEKVYGQKTERLQKILTSIEEKMTAAGNKAPGAEVELKDLQEAIKSLKEESTHLLPQEATPNVNPFTTTPEEVSAATKDSITLARKKMQATLDKLQEQVKGLSDENFQMILDQGEVAPTIPTMDSAGPAVSGKAKTAEEKLVAMKRKRDSLIKAITDVQNELTNKERLLNTAIDPRPSAEFQLNQANPNRGEYKKYLQEQATLKGDTTPLPKSPQGNFEDELKMLLGGDEALQEAKLRGFLTETDLLHAGQTMSEMTQFNSDPHYLPEWTSSTLGKLEFQFKNFGYRQATFMKDRISQLYARGEYGKIGKILLTLATVFPMASEVALDARSIVTGQKRPTWKDDPLGRYLEDLTSAGGFGLMTDLIKNASYGKLLDTLAGPTASTIATAGEGAFGMVTQTLSGEPGKAFKKGVDIAKGIIPPVKALLNRINPPKGKGKDFLHEIFSEITDPLGFPTAYASGPESSQPSPDKYGRPSQAAITPQGITDDNGNLASSSQSKVGKNIIAGVDISKYATDPKHEQKVQSMYDQIGELKTVGDIENHIRAKAPGSPITGQMVAKASAKYDIDPKLLVAIMRQDSQLGTKGLGARTRNPGNVGNNDSGQIIKYKSWQEGVDAVARFLTKYKV